MRYTIKPLEWREYQLDTGEEHPETRYTASTVFSDLNIALAYGRWRFSYCVDEYHDEGYSDFDSVEECKRAARSWYLQRLLPALEEVREITAIST